MSADRGQMIGGAVCAICGGPCRVLGIADQASAAVARPMRRRDRVRALHGAWLQTNQARLAARPLEMRRELSDVAYRQAQRMVQRGLTGTVPLPAREVERAMLRLVTQLRRQRHGALHHVAAEEWQVQCGAIAAELGLRWPLASAANAASNAAANAASNTAAASQAGPA